MPHKSTEMNCAMTVARATPLTPRGTTTTRRISNTMLITVEMIRKYRGDFESPKALSMEDMKL